MTDMYMGSLVIFKIQCNLTRFKPETNIWKELKMRWNKAFSLVEFMIVVLIIGALTAITIPRIIGGTNIAKANCCKTNIDNMNRQIEIYYVNTGSWPNNLKKVTTDTTYFPDGEPECPITGQKYPNTLVNTRVDASDHNH